MLMVPLPVSNGHPAPNLARSRAHGDKLLRRGGVDPDGAVDLRLGDADLDTDGKALQANIYHLQLVHSQGNTSWRHPGVVS